MRKKQRNRWKILLWVTGIYIARGILLFFFQEKFMFHPEPLARNHDFSFKGETEEYNFGIGTRNVNVVRFKTKENSRGTVIYFHGNSQHLGRYAEQADLFVQNGYEVWMPDYPGFGKSTGKISETTLYNDAEYLYSKVMMEVPKKNIIIYGRSIGTGIASWLASRQSAKQLILETPFYSMNKLASDRFPIYPVGWLIQYSFPVHRHLETLQMPVTVIHGTEDEVVPYRHAEKLKKKIPSLHLVTIPGGHHNDLSTFPRFRKTIDSLLRP